MERLHIQNRDDWLKARAKQGIGASESSAVVGMSPFTTASELWEQKALGKKSKDVSDNEAVSRGVRMEPAIRELFKAIHPEFSVDYNPFDILYQTDTPFIFATLDGEITDENGRRGILEIKTASPNGKAGWEKWSERVPDNYYTQILHQLKATGFDFARLFACLISMDGTMTFREYEFERSDLEEDINWITEKEAEFWESVQKKKMPKLTLVI